MANLGIVLGGMAQARDQRMGRELQERSLGIQESQLQFQQQAEQRKLVEANLSEMTEVAANAQKAGATGVVQIMRQRLMETAAASGMDPNARAQMFDAAMEGVVTPEMEAANKAKGTIAEAQAVSDITGAPVNEVLQAKGFLPAPPEQFRTLSDAEKEALDLPPDTLVQISEDSGEIFIKQGDKSQKIMTAIDAETGSPVFVTQEEILASPGKYVPQPSGMKLIQTEDGFVLATGGQEASSADLTNTTTSKLEGAEINVRNMLSRIENIDAAFDPEFLQWGARGTALWSGIKEKAGVELSPEEKEFQTRYTTFASRAIDNINARLNELSGAAVSPAEAERIRASLPDPGDGLFSGDSPTEFTAKVKDLKKRLKLEAMKLSYARQRGLDALSIGVDDFQLVVEQRGKQIEQQVRADNPTAPDREVRTLVQAALMEEFSQ